MVQCNVCGPPSEGAVCRVLHSDLQIKKKRRFPAAPDSCGSSGADSGGRQGR